MILVLTYVIKWKTPFVGISNCVYVGIIKLSTRIIKILFIQHKFKKTLTFNRFI